VAEHVHSQFVSYPSVFLAGRRLWFIGTRQWRFNSAPRTIPQWCKGSAPGNSTVAFLSAFDLMGRSRGLSRVVGSSPIPGIFRGSSTVEQPPQGVIPRRPLPICNFITTRAVTANCPDPTISAGRRTWVITANDHPTFTNLPAV
jgi:hypothetical protein